MPRQRRITPKPQLVLQIEDEDQEKLQCIALALGFTIPSGTNFGKGNISAMIRAIAKIDLEELRKILK